MNGFTSTFLLLGVTACVCVISASPITNTTINCATQSEEIHFGPVDENYSGEVELVTGIEPESSVMLASPLFPEHLEFLELSFTVGQTTATVRTKKPLDADVLKDSTLYYAIVCNGDLKYSNGRTLKLNDLNDNGPKFKQNSYNVTISETHDVDSEVLHVEAVDEDSSAINSRVTYSIEPLPEDFTFTNGRLILKSRLNYNVIKEYHFEVTAQDVGGLNDTATVVIAVQDFDNLNPYFSHSLYQATISENEIGPVTITHPEAIKAQDGDTGINMTVAYSIGAVSPEKYLENFQISSDSGVLSVDTPIDRETMSSSMISVSIKAAQSDDSTKTAEAVVLVTIEDVNDNSPVFDKSSYSIELPENSPVGTIVFTAHVTDVDQGGFVGTLRINPESEVFSVTSDGTVEVRNSTALDRESTGSFTFQIEATERDPPNNVVTVQASVSLSDENDNRPVFTSTRYEGNVYANQTEGMLLVQIQAEDPDVGVNGEVKYSIDFGNDNEYFTIDVITGQISLAKTILLEENRILEFPLYVSATDGGIIPLSSSALVVIRAPSESKPQFLQKVYHGTVEEEQDPGAVILKVDFLAAEIPVTLQLVNHLDKFNIANTGELTTAIKLDFDNGPHNYSVEVTITDGTSTDSATVEVQVTDINDNSPVFASGSFSEVVPEDAEVGSSVIVLTATDKDSSFNKEIRYFLRGGEGKFSVDPVSGMVSVAVGLDREAQSEYNLIVVAEDQGRPARSASAPLLIQVSDVNDNTPKFSEVEYQREVLETLAPGETVVTLSALDLDEGVNGIVTYSILQQSPSSDVATFALDSSTGILRLAQPLDYSKVKVYTLTVQASDGGDPVLVGNSSVVVTVMDVNNNNPEFSQELYVAAVLENLASGASILTLEVTDKDEDGFSNGFFLHTSDTFDISNEGVVSLKNSITLDREKTDFYIFEVVAVDQADDGLRSTAQVSITVLDYNDNAPQFSTIPDPLQIPEGSYSEETPGEVFAIVATDADLGANGEVTVSLSSPHPLFTFRQDGMLLAVGPLDRETRDTYELLVKATDKGSPPMENMTLITVSLIDVNDNRPEFSASSYVSSILLKDAEEGKLLLTLSATDLDDGDNSLISYSFSAGSSPYLALNSETGAVTLTSDLSDIMKDTTLQLTAMAKDHGTPPLSSTVPVVVNLRLASVVENVAFLSNSYNFSEPENQVEGSVVGRVQASSGSDLYDVTYKLKTHTDVFSIKTNGDIVTEATLDKEQQEWYFLDVEAVDTRSPPTSAETLVRVRVENVNEPPEFPDESYKASVFSIAPYKTPVIHVKASDPDVGDSENLVYSVSGDTSHFDVEPLSGLLYVVSAAGLNTEVEVEVKATDPQGLSATTLVKVVVEESGTSMDVVTITLSQLANTVEKKRSELERSLGEVLEWTVNIIEITGATEMSLDTRMTRETVRTLVSFFAVDDDEEVVPAVEVTTKLLERSDVVQKMLAELFGEETDFEVDTEPQNPSSNQATVIALAIVLALSMSLLIVTVVFIVSFKRREKHEKDVHKKPLDNDTGVEGYSNMALRFPETPEMNRWRTGATRAVDGQQKTHGNTADWNGQRLQDETDSYCVSISKDRSSNGHSSSHL